MQPSEDVRAAVRISASAKKKKSRGSSRRVADSAGAAATSKDAAKAAWLLKLSQVPADAASRREAVLEAEERHDAAAAASVQSEPCNVVLTHTNADFDSLAGAVALAKVWSVTRAELPTHVVMPRGVNPLVARFLAFHKHLLPIRGFKTVSYTHLTLPTICSV